MSETTLEADVHLLPARRGNWFRSHRDREIHPFAIIDGIRIGVTPFFGADIPLTLDERPEVEAGRNFIYECEYQ